MFSFYFFFNLLGVLVPAFFISRVSRNLSAPVSLPLTLYIGLVVSICILSLFQLSVFAAGVEIHLKLASHLSFMLTALWFWVMYEYIRRKKMAWTKIGLLFIEPIIMVIITLTNDWHGFLEVQVKHISAAGEKIVTEPGFMRPIHRLYGLTLIGISLTWLAIHLYKHTKRAIIEIVVLILILSLPAASMVMYTLGIIPVRIGAALSIVLILLGVSRFKLLDIVPIGRDRIIDEIEHGVAVVTHQGLVIDANPAAMKLLSQGNVVDKKMALPMKLPQYIYSQFDFQSEKLQQHVHKNELSNTPFKFISLKLSPLYRNNNPAVVQQTTQKASQQAVGFLLFVRDVSRWKEIEQQKQQYINKIEQSHSELIEVNQYKTNFYTNISHEFKTPLTLSSGPVSDIIDGQYGPINEGMKQQLQQVNKHNHRLLDLINQLMSLSKLQSINEVDSFEVITPEITDLVELLPPMVSTFSHTASQNEVTLNLDIQLPEANISMSIDNVEKVVSNLLSNAFKSIKNTGLVTVLLTEHDSGHIKLVVKDTGCGIDQSTLPHIFKRFYNKEYTSTPCSTGWPEGTGIGLALVDQLVTMHQGQISVVSEVDKGSGKQHRGKQQRQKLGINR